MIPPVTESRSGLACYVPGLHVGTHHRGYGGRERLGLRGARVPTTTGRCRRQVLCLGRWIDRGPEPKDYSSNIKKRVSWSQESLLCTLHLVIFS